jgi:hypothetical protein
VLALRRDQRAEFTDFVAFLRTWFAFHEGDSYVLRRAAMDAVFRALTPSLITEVVQDSVDTLLSRWDGGTERDLVADFAPPLPAMVFHPPAGRTGAGLRATGSLGRRHRLPVRRQ